MRHFSQRGGLVSLLSCLASGRPPYLEGETAGPLKRPDKCLGDGEGRSPKAPACLMRGGYPSSRNVTSKLTL